MLHYNFNSYLFSLSSNIFLQFLSYIPFIFISHFQPRFPSPFINPLSSPSFLSNTSGMKGR